MKPKPILGSPVPPKPILVSPALLAALRGKRDSKGRPLI